MNLKILQLIKNKLNYLLKDKKVLDIIVFGSAVKGKLTPRDVDVALILHDLKIVPKAIDGFHFSVLSPEDFVINPPTLINTLLREGYSLRKNCFLAEAYKFLGRVLFIYDLHGLNSSQKVRIVNVLRGKNKARGLVEANGGKWLANGVFIIPIYYDNVFERFFANFKIKYTKNYLLMH